MNSKLMWVLLFVAGAALSWGVYVPLVHRATEELKSNLRAFLFVGIAYFLVAVLIPALFIFVLGDPTEKPGSNFNLWPMLWGIGAGTAGAVGALFVIFAAKTAGKEGVIYVAPLVFAGAPIINALATITIFQPVKTMPDIRFFLGMALAAVGAALVLIYKPAAPAHSPQTHPPAVTQSAAATGHAPSPHSS